MLHKTSFAKGFHILATDGVVGHVDDFLFDEGWTVRYLVVDTSNWIGGRSVLVSTSIVDRIDSLEKKVHLRVTRDQIKDGPSVDTADIALVETLPHVWIM